MALFGLDRRFKQRRERSRFERRVEAQLPSLMRIARGLVGQQADAEDLVHDTCVRALAASRTADLGDEAGLCAWLRQIMINRYRDIYRREQRSPVAESRTHAASDDYDNVVELVANTELSPLQNMENRDSSSAIRHALSSLPPEVRVVSVLFLVGEFSYREIAFITDCPIGTVMSRLSRGRTLLREQLAGFYPGQEFAHGERERSEER